MSKKFWKSYDHLFLFFTCVLLQTFYRRKKFNNDNNKIKYLITTVKIEDRIKNFFVIVKIYIILSGTPGDILN